MALIEGMHVQNYRALVDADDDNCKDLKSDLNKIQKSPPDSIIGAWENLARALGRIPEDCIGADKIEWASRISPYLDLNDPKSPSLKAFLLGINRILPNVIQ